MFDKNMCVYIYI